MNQFRIEAENDYIFVKPFEQEKQEALFALPEEAKVISKYMLVKVTVAKYALIMGHLLEEAEIMGVKVHFVPKSAVVAWIHLPIERVDD